jgi:acyl-CoA synthetase (AMP-forming)/AMP-acid ligase II
VGVDVLLELAASSLPDRVALGSRDGGITFAELGERSAAGAGLLLAEGGRSVAFVGVNGPAFNVAVFAAALSGLPITPLNYRLPDTDLGALLDRLDDPVILVDDSMRARLGERSRLVSTETWLEATKTAKPIEPEYLDDDAIAAVLFTSGTTSEPKGVVLRHGNLTSYVLQTVDLLSAEEDDAALVAVPPYHIAGVATVLTNTYAGRRMVHIPAFDADEWLRIVDGEAITHAMVVPTMLARIVEQLEISADARAELPSLRSIAYGGARIPPTVLERALSTFPNAGFVNAYGLTETSSTIAVLGPDDHRLAFSSDDPVLHGRLASAGRAVPGIEFTIRDAAGGELPTGETGELWVRGAQVAGEYVGLGTGLDADGWFPTRDRAHLDADGYLFVEGRDDDTIIRGGENIAPAEVEDVLLTHPSVRDAAVIGLPDEEWGQSICAVVVLNAGEADDADVAEHVRAFAASRLRSSRAPSSVLIWPELPYTPTGKLLRRTIVGSLTADPVSETDSDNATGGAR